MEGQKSSFLHGRYYWRFTYARYGRYGAGPTKLTPMIRIIPPITVTAFGRAYLSQSHPQAGAEAPYVAPVITKTNPKMNGSIRNYQKVVKIILGKSKKMLLHK